MILHLGEPVYLVCIYICTELLCDFQINSICLGIEKTLLDGDVAATCTPWETSSTQTLT